MINSIVNDIGMAAGKCLSGHSPMPNGNTLDKCFFSSLITSSG